MNRGSVLLVHPERDASREIAQALRTAGFEVTAVPDGERAIDRFIQEPFDILLTEMVLPGRDGGTTAESIRWAPGGQAVCVILLGTRGSDPAQIGQATMRSRAIASYLGPLDPERVVNTVVSAVERPKTALGVRQPRTTPALPDSQSAETPYDFSAPQLGDGPGSVGPTASQSDTGEPSTTDAEALSWDLEPSTDQMEGVPRVDAPGRQDGRGSSVFEGQLDQTTFGELLYRVAASRATGALVLVNEADERRTTSGDHPKKAVFFRIGVPVFVQSNLVEECLGQVLARSGRLSPEQLDESLQRMRAHDELQGVSLRAMGVLDEAGLADALADQLRVKLFDLFAWQSGSFRFSTRMAPPAETISLDMSLPDIVLRGIVHRVAPHRLLRLLDPFLDCFVVPQVERLSAFERLEFVGEARRTLYELDGRATLRTVLQSAGSARGATAQLLYALHCVEGVRFEAQPNPKEPLDRADTSLVTGPRSEASDALASLASLLRADRFFEALDVREGDHAAARLAAEALRRKLERWTQPTRTSRGIRALALEVTARLARFERELGGGAVPTSVAKPLPSEHDRRVTFTRRRRPKRRPAELLNALAKELSPERASAHQEDASRDEPEEQPDGKEAITAETPVGDLAPTISGEPDSHLLAASREDTTAAKALGAQDEEAISSFVDRAIDSARDADLPPPSWNAPPTPRKPPPAITVWADDDVPGFEDTTDVSEDPNPGGDSGRPAPPDPDDLDQRVQTLYQAERSFRRGCRALARGRAEDALHCFRHAVNLCPDEAEFVAHLAFAQFVEAGSTQGESALRRLRHVAAETPEIASIHVLLARALESVGAHDLARDAYAQAVAADPNCKEALSGLRSLATVTSR